MSVALAVGAFAVFVALPQRTFHGVDTDWFALLLDGGDVFRQPTHIGYLPLCWLVLAAMKPFGAGAVQAMLMASALGSALGVFFLHRAALRLAGTRDATLVPIAVALTPACCYFATAAEIPGVFAAASGAAWWAFARWRDDARLGSTLLLGGVCGVAAMVHTLGHLLSPTFVLVMVVWRAMPLKRLAAAAAVIAAAHAVVALGITTALGYPAFGQGAASLTMLAGWAATADPHRMLAALWHECVVCFLPWSALAALAVAVPRARPWALAWLATLLLHVPVVAMFLSRDQGTFVENGAYLLPTAMPAVLAAVALLPRRWSWAATAVSAALSLVLVAPRWAPLYRPEFVAAAAQLKSEREVFFVVGPNELEGIRTHLGGTVCAEIERSIASYFAMREVDPATPPLPVWFDAMVVVMSGPQRVCLVTAEAQQWLSTAPSSEARSLWLDHVPGTYELEPLRRPGLDGVFLRRR